MFVPSMLEPAVLRKEYDVPDVEEEVVAIKKASESGHVLGPVILYPRHAYLATRHGVRYGIVTGFPGGGNRPRDAAEDYLLAKESSGEAPSVVDVCMPHHTGRIADVDVGFVANELRDVGADLSKCRMLYDVSLYSDTGNWQTIETIVGAIRSNGLWGIKTATGVFSQTRRSTLQMVFLSIGENSNRRAAERLSCRPVLVKVAGGISKYDGSVVKPAPDELTAKRAAEMGADIIGTSRWREIIAGWQKSTSR